MVEVAEPASISETYERFRPGGIPQLFKELRVQQLGIPLIRGAVEVAKEMSGNHQENLDRLDGKNILLFQSFGLPSIGVRYRR